MTKKKPMSYSKVWYDVGVTPKFGAEVGVHLPTSLVHLPKVGVHLPTIKLRSTPAENYSKFRRSTPDPL